MRRTRIPERALEALLEEQAIAADGEGLVVACSGGADSVALASLLARLAPKHAWRLVLGHVNHAARPSSGQDECVALAAGARLGIAVRIVHLEPGKHDEATLRERRYASLVEIARASGAKAVVTAHTAEDQTETVLLALFRGTGPEGLAGIPARRVLAPGIDVVRPLLRVSRESLHAELGANALAYVQDPSNADLRYRRNLVRDVLARLRPEFPGLDEAVARCALLVADELSGDGRADARRRLRATLAAEEGVGLADVPFERIEAALRARRGRVHIRKGVEINVDVASGGNGADARVIRRKT